MRSDETLIQLGVFPATLQPQIDAEFRCVTPEAAMADEALRTQVRGIITRSNQQVPQALLEALPALRVIATSGVGYDGIPVAWAHARGIIVTHTPGVLDAAVCELGIGLLLALLREIPQSDRHVRDGSWRGAGAYPLTRSLAGKRIGIVGLGRIGKGIAARLAPFGPGLIAYAGGLQAGSPYRHCPSALALAAEVDVMFLCCKGGAETRHLINAEVLRALGAGWLVNIARGSVVDEAALCEALTRGELRGAALDVFGQEPLGEASPLADLPNVILSPHAGSATHETRADMLRLTLDNLNAVLAGRDALTAVPRLS
ncbi:MAG TPA: 2-hydroxyacid dehydrogenase [Roseateles sp.]|nr:2-hydroxyacid dehydrogenase [Roseateles sp.]